MTKNFGEAGYCPECGYHSLICVEGMFGTGVFAPDGVQETVYDRFLACDRCGKIFDESDLPSPNEDADQGESRRSEFEVLTHND